MSHKVFRPYAALLLALMRKRLDPKVQHYLYNMAYQPFWALKKDLVIVSITKSFYGGD
jgi:hypothetical protein